MSVNSIFLSVVFLVRNQSTHIERILLEASASIAPLVDDYELIVVDNASDDDTISVLKNITGETSFPNLQVYALTKEVDTDIASWVGLENALGDLVAVMNPLMDDIAFLPAMLDKAFSGADVVFANNEQESAQSFVYQCVYAVFNGLYMWLNGISLTKDAPRYRLLSRKVINFILQHPQPTLTYRHLPATGGFVRDNLTYSSAPKALHTKQLREAVDRGIRLLLSTTKAPMRLVTTLSLFGATANLVYSIYVIGIGFLKTDVAPGWVSLSLQQSGMFFLISLVLLILGEYILYMASLSNVGPLYHVGQEFTSTRITCQEKLNIEEVTTESALIVTKRVA
jgi:hypothetical protein